MISDKPRPDSDAVAVLEDALPLIRRVLTAYYRFMDEEAEAFEDTLRVWFQRMFRRTTPRQVQNDDLRMTLIVVACKYARAFQIAKFRGTGKDSDQFTMALARPPEEVAMELLRCSPGPTI